MKSLTIQKFEKGNPLFLRLITVIKNIHVDFIFFIISLAALFFFIPL
jgi:hypothetical protein